MQTYYLKFFCALILVTSCMANGSSRHDDGEALIRSIKGNICFSGKEYKSSGLFVNKSISIDNGDVEIDEISVVSDKTKKATWKVAANNENRIKLTSRKCIGYGEKLEGYKETVNLELEPGQNKVMIIAYDIKNNNRAFLYGKFCILKNSNGIELVDCE